MIKRFLYLSFAIFSISLTSGCLGSCNTSSKSSLPVVVTPSTNTSEESSIESSIESSSFEESSTVIIEESSTIVESSTEESSTEETTTEMPTTEAPTQPPTTEAPTQPPTTEAPTQPPTTEAPTQPPTTEAPTQPPTTEAPTQPPTTEPITSEEPSSEKPSNEEPSSEELSNEDSSSEELSSEDSSTEDVSNEESSSDDSSTEDVSNEESSNEESSNEELSSDDLSFGEQSSEELSSEDETTKAPTTQAPTTEAPTSPAQQTATVVHTVTVKKPGTTYTGYRPLSQISYEIIDPLNTLNLSSSRRGFSFGAAKNGQPHQTTINNQRNFDSYNRNSLAWDNKTSGKVLYLTFDCGYAYQDLTSRILNTLKEKNVPAAFFCTLDYLKGSPNDVTRMIKEGHIVGNHSSTHPIQMSTFSRTDIAWELLGAHNYLRINYGYDSKYFRFPEGAYSINALDVVDCVGYRSVFWSIAHADWDPANQPGVEVSFNTVTSRLHPGAVILLHSTSPDNADILGRFIDYARAQGYEFRSLDQYNYWKD